MRALMHDLIIKIQNLSACFTDYYVYSMLTTLSYSYSHFPPRQTEVSMTQKYKIFQTQAGHIKRKPLLPWCYPGQLKF